MHWIVESLTSTIHREIALCFVIKREKEGEGLSNNRIIFFTESMSSNIASRSKVSWNSRRISPVLCQKAFAALQSHRQWSSINAGNYIMDKPEMTRRTKRPASPYRCSASIRKSCRFMIREHPHFVSTNLGNRVTVCECGQKTSIARVIGRHELKKIISQCKISSTV